MTCIQTLKYTTYFDILRALSSCLPNFCEGVVLFTSLILVLIYLVFLFIPLVISPTFMYNITHVLIRKTKIFKTVICLAKKFYYLGASIPDLLNNSISMIGWEVLCCMIFEKIVPFRWQQNCTFSVTTYHDCVLNEPN